MWLLKTLTPDHNTISNFRRDNPQAIKKVFRETVRVANYFNLIGGTLIAGDSTKLRAQNSKKNNFNEKKIERHLGYIEKKLEEIVELVNNVMVDPDIDIEYCIPDVATTSETCDVSGDPYILATYIVSEYTRPTRKIRLSGSNMQNTPRVIADLVTFSIEQFKTDIDSVEMG